MFHPFTYEGYVDIDSIEDEVMREGMLGQIKHFGQTPTQIFKSPHVARLARKSTSLAGGADMLIPAPLRRHSEAVYQLMWLAETGAPTAVGAKRTLLQPDLTKVVYWGHWDQSLRVMSVDNGKVLTQVKEEDGDDVLACVVPEEGRVVVASGSSGVVKVWKVAKLTRSTVELERLARLYGHSSATAALAVSRAFSVIVSGSDDSSAIVWDLNSLTYIRTLWTSGPVAAVAICQSSGDIATVSRSGGAATVLSLWSINGAPVAAVACPSPVTSLEFSAQDDMASVLSVGFENGTLGVYSTEDLTVLARYSYHQAPITAVAFNKGSTTLVTSDNTGNLTAWTRDKGRKTLWGTPVTEPAQHRLTPPVSAISPNSSSTSVSSLAATSAVAGKADSAATAAATAVAAAAATPASSAGSSPLSPVRDVELPDDS